MKNLIALFLLSFIIISLHAQTLDCGDGSATFSEVNCTDDYLSFVVTSNNAYSLHLITLPNGFQWSLQDGSLTSNSTNPTSLSLYNNLGDEPINFFSVMVSNISNPGCGVFNLSPIFFSANSTSCSDLSVLLNQADVRPIPTLGQWGLIVLALFLSISGITLIRRVKVAT